jgi:hypothetical protein
VAPLRGSAGDLEAPTISAKNINDRSPGMRCQRFGSAHHQRKKMSMVSPPGRRCRRSMSTHHQRKKHRQWPPLGGGAGGPGAPTINIKNIDDGPPGRHHEAPGAPTIILKMLMAGPLTPVGGGGRSLSKIQKVCCDLHGQHR